MCIRDRPSALLSALRCSLLAAQWAVGSWGGVGSWAGVSHRAAGLVWALAHRHLCARLVRLSPSSLALPPHTSLPPCA
eukprot:3219368-Rhodomonas_salina.1